jgi:hypothetical protein
MKRLIVFFHVLVFVSMFISLAEAQQYINNCPVPDDLKIIAPDGNSVPPKLALLSGVWEGSWSARSVIFVVEQIQGNEAVVVEAWTGAKYKTRASIEPGFSRKKCPIEQDEDGNYRIIFAVKNGTHKLIQTNDPQNIKVIQEGFGLASSASAASIFRKKELK